MKQLLTILFFLLTICANAQLGSVARFKHTVNLTSIKPPSLVTDTTYSDSAKFVTFSNTITVSGWTPINSANAAPHVSVSTGVSSPYTASTNTTTAWNAFGGNTINSTVGENASDGGGFAFNASAQRAGSYNYNDTYSGSTSDANFKISGCTPGQLYNVQLLPSCDAGLLGFNSESTAKLIHASGTTTYTSYMDGTRNVGATTSTSTGVVTTGNTSKYFSMWGVADASGFLFVWIGGTDNATDAKRLGFANGLIIRKATITIH